jgi:hypothetical protein
LAEIRPFLSAEHIAELRTEGASQFATELSEHWCGGADQAGLNSNFGLAGCGQSHPCSLCEAPSSAMCCSDVKKGRSYEI